MKKGIFTVLMAAVLSMAAALSAYAGEWVFDGPEYWQKWYKEDDGSRTISDWKQIDGKWYHFDYNGYLDVGGWFRYEVKNENGSSWEWFYLDDSGVWIENLTTDTGHMTPKGFRTDHDFSSKEDKEYWNAKVQEYGYDKIEVSEVVRGDDGYKYAVLHFPYIDNAGDFGKKMTGKTVADCKEVADWRVEQLFPYFDGKFFEKKDELEFRILYWGKESNGEWVQDGPYPTDRYFMLNWGEKAYNYIEIDGKSYFLDYKNGKTGHPCTGWKSYLYQDFFTYLSFFDEYGGRVENFTTDTGHVGQDGNFCLDHENNGPILNSEEDNAYWNAKIQEYGYDQNMKESTESFTDSESGIFGGETEYEYTVRRYSFPFVGGAEDSMKHTGVTWLDCCKVAEARVRQLYPSVSDLKIDSTGRNRDGVYVDVLESKTATSGVVSRSWS
ncbi:hypothetical protein SAMN04487771_101943 [[Clostridium] aminophilum]|uniref:Cell wall binding repeat-containing protein n=1 Tax=[Clostridium] aminophilum TaxID=1526 RepID=A0A1I0EPE0_9FIRM|nr:hypothetical protein [[Clostridium] aminophilum]SET46445.1 hypothetical protein SAMN04487771_101943 [[Clostridium] aminophilum]